jgi:divalent metal cation (Fe/Co/Zn/Cd) transporter
MKIAKERKSSVLASNAVHHRIDSLTSIVALLTIGGAHIFSDASWLDPVGGLIISLMVIQAGWGNTRMALLELADTTVDEDIKSSVHRAALKLLLEAPDTGEVEIRDIQGMKSGQNYLMEVELAVPGSWSVDRSRQIEALVREGIGGRVRGVRRVKVRFVSREDKAVGFTDEFITPDISSRGSPEPTDPDIDPHDHRHSSHEGNGLHRRG